MTTIQSFVATYRVRMSQPEWIDHNPQMTEDDWSRGASHYKLTLKCGRRQMTTYFSMGSAHTSEPQLADVLDCLASDAAGVENAQSFENWCAEYGYDTDSRKAEKTFKICERQAENLKRLLGDDAFDQLLWHTERN
jgi:hypothetical protein